MQTLPDPLDHVAANYYLQAPALLLLFGVGLGTSPVLAGASGVAVRAILVEQGLQELARPQVAGCVTTSGVS